MKKILIGTLFIFGFTNMNAQIGMSPESVKSKEHFEKIACYCYHDNRMFVISKTVFEIDENIKTKEYVVIKSKHPKLWSFDLASDVLFQTEINGSFGDCIDIHQAFGDPNLTNKIIKSPTKYYGADCQFQMLDSTFAVVTSKLYLKESNQYNGYPILYILKYDYNTKYWTRITSKTFSQRQYETLVIKEINENKFLIYNTIESCSIVINDQNIELIDLK